MNPPIDWRAVVDGLAPDPSPDPWDDDTEAAPSWSLMVVGLTPAVAHRACVAVAGERVIVTIRDGVAPGVDLLDSLPLQSPLGQFLLHLDG